MKKKSVAVIYGGMGAEREISVLSAKFVLSKIDRELFSPIPVFITDDGLWLIRDVDKDNGIPCYPARTKCGSGLMSGEGFIPIHTAFPVLHGDFGEDGIVQGALECAGIPFVGCGTRCGAICHDKAVAKTLAEAVSVPTAPWILGNEDPTPEYIENVKRRAELSFGYPMFIKPTGGGSSIGISRVETDSDFNEAYLNAAKYGSRVIIEKAAAVRLELECAVLIVGKQMFTKIGAVETCGSFYDFRSKYMGGITATPSPDVNDRILNAVTEYSKTLCAAFEVRQISRIDFFLCEEGEIIFNEINPMPGFTASSLYPKLMDRCGISPCELISRLILGASL